MATEDAKNTPSQEQMPDKGRRDTLKTLATVPILGALAYGVYQKRKDALRVRNISDVFQVSNRQASYLEPQGDGKKAADTKGVNGELKSIREALTSRGFDPDELKELGID
jgi:hypothetical protein